MESKWITIADSDLNDYLVAAQMQALRTAALATGQDNPFTKVAADVIYRVRTKVQSCQSNIVSSDTTTIPPECKWIACLLIIDGMQGRLPMLKLYEHQKDQIKEAIRQLDRIADCKDRVTTPSDALPTDVQTGGPIELLDTNVETLRRTVTEGSMAGLC